MKPPVEFWYLVGFGIMFFLLLAGIALATWAGAT